MSRFILVVLLVGCIQQPSHVYKVAVADNIVNEDLPFVHAAGEPWAVLDFGFEWLAADDPTCDFKLSAGSIPTAGQTFRDEITISSNIHGYPLFDVTAHELGHALLGPRHLEPGVAGVMAAVDPHAPLTEADLELAREESDPSNTTK